jgi:hypothetical protein
MTRRLCFLLLHLYSYGPYRWFNDGVCYVKRILTTTLGLFLLLSFFFAQPLMPNSQAQGGQNAALQLQIEAGYEGYFRANSWLPVSIAISNSGAPVQGTLRILTSDGFQTGPAIYNAAIDLPTQSAKQLFLYLPMNAIFNEVRVELVTTDQILASDTQNMRLLQENDLLFAVVSEAARGTLDFTSMQTGFGRVAQANWGLENIPSVPEALTSVNALVIIDADTGNLSLGQRQAIADWVIAGGHLIVAGGPNWQRTAAGLADLLPMTPTNEVTLAALPSLATRIADDASLSVANNATIIISTGQVKENAQVLVSQSVDPLLVRQSLGVGLVDYVTFDPSLAPFNTWDRRNAFWLSLLAAIDYKPNWSGGIVSDQAAENAGNYVQNLTLPDVVQMVGFLFAYVLIVGPVNYVILLLLRRRELAWLTIPVVVVITSLVYYNTGFSLRGTQATINRLAIVQVWYGAERGKVNAILGVLSPRRAQYDLSVQPGFTLKGVNTSDSGLLGGSRYTITAENDQYTARNINLDASASAIFAASGFVPVERLSGEATINLTSQPTINNRDPNSFSGQTLIRGSITNTTGQVLRDVVVLAMGGSQPLGTLQPGEQKQFTFTVVGNYSPPAPFSNNSIFSYYSPTFGYAGVGNYQTITDLLGTQVAPCEQVTSTRGLRQDMPFQELWRRACFLNAIIANSDPTGGRGTSVYVAGWTDSAPMTYDLRGAITSESQSTTLYVYQIPASINAFDNTEQVYVPGTYIMWSPAEISNRPDFMPYNFSVQPGEVVAFRYAPMDNIPLAEVDEINILFDFEGTGRGLGDNITIYNWQTKQWDALRDGGSTFVRLINPDAYIGPDNSFEIKIESGSSRLYFESISVSLVGKLR